MYLNYLHNWPKIPEDLHHAVQSIVDTGNDELHKFVGAAYDPYKLYPIIGPLKTWITNHLPIQIGSCCHIHMITNDLVIHKDYMQEKYKVNYIFTTGGTDVKTNFYDNDFNLLQSYVVPAFTWHWFDGTINHNATKITAPRVAITIGTNDVDRLDFRAS